jgi:lactate dehydrogenase-like 2-hydroxyacid dehydrogenase
MRILLSTTSYQDTPGPHHELLATHGWEIVRERGPLSEQRMLELAGDFDGFLCGDDGITQAVIDKDKIAEMRDGVILLNCARGELVITEDMNEGLHSGKVGGYGADVLDVEPPPPNHPLLSAPNTVITSHIGSRTHESVIRQATMATENLLRFLNGEAPLAQANRF